MRRLLRSIARVITAPFRLIARPFRAVGRFLNHEPDEMDTADSLRRTLENPSALLEHLQALRGHLLRGLLALGLATAVSFAFATQILDWMATPVGGIGALQAIEVTESIGAFMRVSLLSGLTLALPYLIIEAFAFVNPGLRRRERVTLLVLIPLGVVMFVAGLVGPSHDQRSAVTDPHPCEARRRRSGPRSGRTLWEGPPGRSVRVGGR